MGPAGCVIPLHVDVGIIFFFCTTIKSWEGPRDSRGGDSVSSYRKDIRTLPPINRNWWESRMVAARDGVIEGVLDSLGLKEVHIGLFTIVRVRYTEKTGGKKEKNKKRKIYRELICFRACNLVTWSHWSQQTQDGNRKKKISPRQIHPPYRSCDSRRAIFFHFLRNSQ